MYPYIKFNGSQVSNIDGKPVWKFKQNKIKSNKIIKHKKLVNDIFSTSIAHKKTLREITVFLGLEFK